MLPLKKSSLGRQPFRHQICRRKSEFELFFGHCPLLGQATKVNGNTDIGLAGIADRLPARQYLFISSWAWDETVAKQHEHESEGTLEHATATCYATHLLT